MQDAHETEIILEVDVDSERMFEGCTIGSSLSEIIS